MQIVKQTAYGIVITNFMNNKCFKLPFDYPKMRADQLVDIYIYVCVCVRARMPSNIHLVKHSNELIKSFKSFSCRLMIELTMAHPVVG